jgi:type VI protein secretion system component VasK
MESSTQKANAEGHYILLTIAVIIGIVGVYLRFADFKYASAVANTILVIGVIVTLKAVFAILK